MNTFTLQPVTSIWIVLILAVCALLMMFVRPSFSKISKGQRQTLNLLRTGVVLLALLGLLRPGCVQTEEELQSGVLLCLLDTSRSMELPHDKDDSTRWDAIVDTMRKNEGRFQQLADKKIDVRFYGFDNEMVQLEFDGQLNLPSKPEGGETDLASPLFNSSRETRGERLIGVVLMSDGVPTVLNPPVEISQAVTPLVNMETPLFSIPLGSPADTGQSRDVAITNFAEQHVVNVKNRLIAEATVATRGYQGQDIRVELVVIDSSGREEVVNPPRIVTPQRATQEIIVPFEYKPTEPGEFRIKVRAVPMPGEIALRNNELDAFLTVNDKGLSVVLIDGGMLWEQSFMRRSLATAEFLDLQFIPIYPSEIDAGPRDELVELFEDETVDVFILSNIDSRLLYDEVQSPLGLRALSDAVTKRGKGLMMLGGPHSFGPGLYHQTPLDDLLPIKMLPTERQDFGTDIVRRFHISGELKMKPAANHPLTQLGDDSPGWSKLPPLVGANRFAGVKKNALILLESDDQAAHPLLVASINGGRILAFAGDSLWRWNMKRHEDQARTFKPEYDQFWRQAILWLANWDSRNDDSISIEFPQRRFQPKGRVRFGVNAQSITGETLTDVIYKAVLTQPDGETQLVAVTDTGPGNWSEVERDMIAQPGVYLLEVEGQRNGTSLGTAQRQFVVVDRDVEKSNPVADVERMAMLANQTRDFGGKLIGPDELSDVLDAMIKDPPVEKVQIPTKWKFGETMSHSLGFLMIFVALLATEWVLRKKWGLV
ncbi:glutamine amidotransferase [Mariniblastus fucicola]|uniref:Putative glutamine amidotransferase domain-containing protein n=1 Tax=Mariniblastus fucicola TaxID=980251 RepID=A0A5B9P5L4_9BACT|nr:glutamine amidotransferase [Mariniblastus fucicola]QEG21678.1 hypothetical protein MFFC18_15360 [Mariniblastus fucicola]